MSAPSRPRDLAIWAFALGYFLCYAPYSALTKTIAQGHLPGMTRALSGFALLPITTFTSMVGMFVFLTLMGWWKYAGRRPLPGAARLFGKAVTLPLPGRWTFLSGLCSAAIIGTTTLSYAISGVSIVFMMLMMRGGVLVIAPLVDALGKRHVRWFSWVALALSLGALLVTFSIRTSYALTAIAAVDVLIYLAAYFIRLRFMSHLAKSDDPTARTRYFVEEQMVATPAIVMALGLLALVGGDGAITSAIRAGFTDVASSGAVLGGIAVGLLSQGTGIFGGLILLDRRENTFCVPVNRASSVLAGIVATLAMTALLGAPAMPRAELAGAVLILTAIAVLAIAPAMEGRRPLLRPAGAH
ncbi:MAG: hypothetical protein U0359_08630 [Byssovorax sp.]